MNFSAAFQCAKCPQNGNPELGPACPCWWETIQDDGQGSVKLPLSFPTLVPKSNDLEGLRQLFQDLTSSLQQIAGANNYPDNGPSTARATQQLVVGQVHFDTTLGKPVWWTGTAWVDGAGTPV